MKTDSKKNNHYYKSYDIVNKTKKIQYNNMKEDFIMSKSMDSNENTKTNFKNTSSDINNFISILENKGIDGLPVKIMGGDNIKVSESMLREILAKINKDDKDDDNYCKTCCKIFSFFCKIIKILLLILFFCLYITSCCCFCNFLFWDHDDYFCLDCERNLHNCVCSIYQENGMEHCCDCCLDKCRCCRSCCNC